MSSHLTYSDDVAIAKLAYYTPALFISLYVTYKHGFSRGSGWVFLAIFCIIRIVGSGAQLATINNDHPDTAYTIALITTVLGLSPLLLATLGIISRIYYSILKQPYSTFFSLVGMRAVQIPAIVALILCIVGATSAATPEQIEGQSTVHIGIILFAVVFGLLVLLDGGAIIASRMTQRGEVLLIVGVTLALPFLAVRLVYSLLVAFAHDKQFNLATGSQTISLCMETLEEMAVVLIYLITGLRSPPVPKTQDGQQRSTGGTLGYRAGRGDFNGGRLGLISLAAAAGNALGGKNNQRRPQQQRGQRRHHRHHRSQSDGYPLSTNKAYQEPSAV